MEKAKLLEFKDGKVLVELEKELDPNKDGQAVLGMHLKLWVDLSEVADEAVDFWKKKKAE